MSTGNAVRTRKFDDTWIRVDGDGEARKTTVTDLENGVTYSFQVRAVNKKLGAWRPIQ